MGTLFQFYSNPWEQLQGLRAPNTRGIRHVPTNINNENIATTIRIQKETIPDILKREL